MIKTKIVIGLEKLRDSAHFSTNKQQQPQKDDYDKTRKTTTTKIR